jgi:hypothetical protein
MTFIVLHRPIASSAKLERLHLFPGRHLGEEEFDRQQAYSDARLAPLLKNHPTGIVRGLNLSSQGAGSLLQHDSFVVNPGLAVTSQGQTLHLQMPLRAQWQAVIEHYLSNTATDDASGVYYLVLRQAMHTIDSPSVDPCQRAEFDPTRDSRLVTVTSVELKRLAIAPALISTMSAQQLQNWIVADRVDSRFLNGFIQSVPLALLAITTTGNIHDVNWVSEAAGRYEATADSGYRVLLNQTSESLRQVMQAHSLPANQATPLSDFLNSNLQLDYLPAAGQLPTAWLQQADTITPSLLWLPTHLGIDMVPVPTDSVNELLNRHIARRVIDLRQPAGDKIRLLVALKHSDYQPDILDIPPTDSQLEADIYRFYMRAYNAWRRWREQFDKLYYVEPSDLAPLTSPADLVATEHAVLDPTQFKQLDLPKPTQPPIVPLTLFQNVISRARSELVANNSNPSPYPYSNGVPPQPDFYRDWLVTLDSVQVPPPTATPTEDGLVIQYAVALVELEAIENQIRAIRTRLEKTRDYLLLQRQQLDSQTVALASLAGGVAGDGNGLQVARWLPYASLSTDLIPQELSAAAATTQNVASSAPATVARSSGSNTNSALLINKGFSQNLLSAALNTSTKSSPSYLTSKPQTYSAFELGINTKRLDLLANLSKSAISSPAYKAKEFRFGVLDHISPEINEYRKAYFGMQDLLTTLSDLFDATDASSLRNQLKSVMKDKALLDPQVLESQITKRATALLADYSPDEAPSFEKLRGLVASQKRYEALFTAGKVLTQWIAITEARYNKVERKLQGKLRQHTAKLAQIEKLSGLIRVAREALENLDRFFDEQVGDYGVAQRLLEEDWREVYDKHQQRSRILTNAIQGLYYVRVRNTPVSMPLADPLSLRYKNKSDIVPGCDWNTDVDLPQELASFFDAVSEIPMDDWANLKPLHPKLPPFHRYEYVNKLRAARFKARPNPVVTSTGTDTLQARLHTVQLQTQSVVNQWANLTLPAFTSSIVQTQQQAAKVFSLEDLSQNANGYLRKQAQTLRERLEQCQACLLEKLNLLPGSIRLQWGQLAEDDRIRVEDVSWWPGLERAEQDDFNATRTLAELISWWFKQLDSDASSASHNAMRNMIRATLIFASLGDPQEIIRGTVFSPPRLTLTGERFRVKLNRQILPGTRLQLLDTNQQVAAELSVEDHSPDSTQVRIINVVQANVKINARFAVVGNVRAKR